MPGLHSPGCVQRAPGDGAEKSVDVKMRGEEAKGQTGIIGIGGSLHIESF
jgi:hypothetical protein